MAVKRMSASKSKVGECIRYAVDPRKTDNGRYVSGINCIPRLAEKQFIQTKDFWSSSSGIDKSAGVKCHVGFLSFKEGEVDAETAHRIGVELAERLWGDTNEVVVATHLNTTHLHDHFVVNSVSWRTGIKRAAGKISLIDFKKEVTRIRLEYGLSVDSDKYEREVSRLAYLAEKEGRPTIRSIIRQDIDRAVRESLTLNEFTEALQNMGYRVILSEGKEMWYPGLFPPGGSRCYSFRYLGREYELKRLKERILENTHREKKSRVEIDAEVSEYRKRKEPVAQSDDLLGKLKKYDYEIDLIIECPESVRMIPESVRRDIVRTDLLKKYIEFLDTNSIRTEESLTGFITENENRMELLLDKRNDHERIQENAKRRGDKEVADKNRIERLELTKQISELRKKIGTARNVSEKSKDIDGKLELLESLHERAMGKEEREDEQLVVRSGGSGREDSAAGDRDRG